MSTLADSGHPGRPNQVLVESSESLSPPEPALDPDNPPWGLWRASLTWVGSVALIVLVPQLCVLPYLVTNYRGATVPTKEVLFSDKTFVLTLVIGLLVAYVLALLLTWAMVTSFGKFPFRKALGLSWPSNFGVAKSTGLALLLFLLAMFIVYKFGGQDTDMEKLLRSSRAAALIIALIATALAPIVEEVIYRGLLYSALQRLAGPIAGVIVVTSVFAALHVFQYWPDFGAIASISLLSLVLTAIRARTGRLMPCFVIHLVFNGIQSLIIVLDPYLRSLYESSRPDAVPAGLHALFNLF